MLYLYRLAVGYVRLIFYGENNERILDLAAKNRITLWDSRLTKNGIESSVTIKDFKKLRNIRKGSGIKLHIVKKKGLPFKINKNRKRMGLLIGSIIFIAFLYIMSGYIWVINVDGNYYVSTEEIMGICREMGIEIGTKKSKINPKQQRQVLLLKSEKLSWASLNIEGSKLTVNVSETERVHKDTNAYNIKALKDGIIKKIDVTNGTCVVKIGDVVKKGDLLVSGVVEESATTKFVNSEGSIFAETINEIKVAEKYNRLVEIPTGKVSKRRVIEFFGVKVPLYLGSVKGEYSTESAAKNLKLFGTDLPINIYEKKFIFNSVGDVTSTKEELKILLEERLKKKLEEHENPREISKSFTETKEGIELVYKFKITENIATKDKLLHSDGT